MSEVQNSEVTIQTLPPMRVACLRTVSPTPEDDGSARMQQWIESQHFTSQPRSFGFDVEVTPEEGKNGMRGYEMWRTVPDTIVPSQEITIQDFPGGLYAVMTLERCFEDPFERIPSGWKQLHEWVIHHEKYLSASHQWLEEVIDVEYGTTLKLYHPIMLAPVADPASA